MAKKHNSYPVEPTLDMGFDEMDAASQQENGPVTVLGMTFSNDEERRAYFREQLRAKLPELRSIEGFPIGSDDDIVNLSDPPYYTACPNPWLNDFIAEWEQEKLHLEAEGKRHPNVVVNEPYAADNNDIKTIRFIVLYFNVSSMKIIKIESADYHTRVLSLSSVSLETGNKPLSHQ